MNSVFVTCDTCLRVQGNHFQHFLLTLSRKTK